MNAALTGASASADGPPQQVLLMGCSSLRLVHEGVYDGDGPIRGYLDGVVREPALTGCLWDVTDGEIDRFTVGMLEGQQGGGSASSRGLDVGRLSEHLQRGLGQVQLAMLSGSAICTVGTA